MKEAPELPELEDDSVKATEAEARELNGSHGEAEQREIAKAMEAMHFQNLTVIEVMQDRSVGSIIQALSKVYARFRSLGVQIFRLHSDREKSFLAWPVQRWCESRSLLQSMTGGDDAKSKGRVESEVNQIKRRTRLLLHESGLPHGFWVCALRRAAEHRLRAQLHRLGVMTRPMLRFASTMSVKTKRWHRSGQLSNWDPVPSCPTDGWRGIAVAWQHVRSAWVQAEGADQALHELQLHGKQPPVEEDPLESVVGALYHPALSTMQAGGGTTLWALSRWILNPCTLSPTLIP